MTSVALKPSRGADIRLLMDGGFGVSVAFCVGRHRAYEESAR